VSENKMQSLIDKAQSGDLESQFELGLAYKYGKDGFTQDIREAYRCFELAAELNHALAQYHFALMHISDNSDGCVKDDKEKAVYWLEKAVSNGDFYAIHTLIDIYENSASDDNAVTIIKLFEVLVNNHQSIEAMIELGTIYCAAPDNMNINKIPKLASHRNPDRGFRLIEDGVRLAESAKKNQLDYMQYQQISHAYMAYTRPPNEQGVYDYFNKSETTFAIALAKKIGYTEKSNTLFENDPPPYLSQERVKNLIEEINPKKLRRSRTQFIAFLGMIIDASPKITDPDVVDTILKAIGTPWAENGRNIDSLVREAFPDEKTFLENEKRRQKEVAERAKREEQKREEKYNSLLVIFNASRSESEIKKLAKQFQELGNYKDAPSLSKECKSKYLSMKEAREEQEQMKATIESLWENAPTIFHVSASVIAVLWALIVPFRWGGIGETFFFMIATAVIIGIQTKLIGLIKEDGSLLFTIAIAVWSFVIIVTGAETPETSVIPFILYGFLSSSAAIITFLRSR